MTIRFHLGRRALSGLLAVTLAAATALAAAPAHAAPAGSLQPVPRLDVERYLGTWWQQAAIPGFYSVRCLRDTSAHYGLIDATTISVNNTCVSPTGRPDGIRGQAKVVDPRSRAQLSVSFPGVPGTLNPQNTPNYIVTWVADGPRPGDPYEYAIVGDPTRLSGFILSRDRVISTRTLLMLRDKAEERGFNTCLFLTSPTTGGRSDYLPLCLVR
ncbi:lipocalin family protein [Gordonia sp. (in: high G+C Gram-positive bacteria)]|uniref:lipocalin family protein n=1 Tax=Gordonia sp. (in: high G+C Gram-positive bacteria) TaxID=84139 RepID=UPI0026175A3E|nr:lipocalin family protein [Gordonia sp. (in: high G+C Gram-positive bacteria)]